MLWRWIHTHTPKLWVTALDALCIWRELDVAEHVLCPVPHHACLAPAVLPFVGAVAEARVCTGSGAGVASVCVLLSRRSTRTYTVVK